MEPIEFATWMNLVLTIFVLSVLLANHMTGLSKTELFTRLDDMPKRWRYLKPEKPKAVESSSQQYQTLLADAKARQKGLTLDGLKRRETVVFAPNAPQFKESPLHERSMSNDERDSIARWNWIDSFSRSACRTHLRIVFNRADNGSLLNKWINQLRRGVAIGSDNPHFHLSIGMSIRNELRRIIPDDKLPGGDNFKNWDYFYYGAINAMVLAESTKRNVTCVFSA